MAEEPRKVQSLRKAQPTVLDDPGLRSVVQVYAEAFLNAAESGEQDATEAVADLQTLVDEVFLARPDIAEPLLGGAVSRDGQLQLIDRVIAPRTSRTIGNFLRVLASHDRLHLLPAVSRSVGVKFDERRGRKRVRVTTAHAMPDDFREHVRRQLDSALPFEPVLETSEDGSLLGGLVVQIDDKVYDASVRTRLNQLRARLVAGGIHR